MELFREFRFRYFNVAGEFAGREPDRNGDVAFHHALGRIPAEVVMADQAVR